MYSGSGLSNFPNKTNTTDFHANEMAFRLVEDVLETNV